MNSPKTTSPIIKAKQQNDDVNKIHETPTKSPYLGKELIKIQNTVLKGKSADYMKGLEDFCLD